MSETPPFSAIWVGELDLGQPLVALHSPTRPGGTRYARARLLVRDGARVVGVVDIPLGDGVAEPEQLRAQLLRQVGAVDATRSEVEDANVSLGRMTVIVCTGGRPDSLRRALASILRSEDASLELIVVDNTPRDPSTHACVRELDDPRLRYVAEHVRGLSAARNRGIAEARGELIAFTDDDVVVDGRWLAQLAAPFANAPRIACVTGLALAAELETAEQAYFESKVKWSSRLEPRLFDLDQHRGGGRLFPYTAGDFGAGVNFAVRRSALAEIGPFDEALGVGTPSRGGEDLDFFARVILRGWVLAYQPAAVVWHTHRRERAALERQMRGYGSGLGAYAFKHLCAGAAVPRIAVAMLARRRGTPVRARAPRRTAEWLPGMRRAELIGLLAGPWGYLRGRWAMRRRRRASSTARIDKEPTA